jgi:hypothetical protein
MDLNIPSLQPGETYRNGSIDTVIEDSGDYTVEFEVDDTPDASGFTDNATFEAKFSELGVNVDAISQSGTDGAFIDTTLNNNGTGDSDPTDVQLLVNNSDGDTVYSEVLSYGSIGADRSSTQRTTINNLDDEGTHIAFVEVQPAGDTDQDTFANTEPDLLGEVTANNTQITRYEDEVFTNVTNNGTDQQDSTTVTIRAYDEADNVVYSNSYGTGVIEPGESAVQQDTVQYPDVGNYTVEMEVDNPQGDSNIFDRTETVRVVDSVVSIETEAVSTPIAPGQDGEIDVTITNDGNTETDPQTVESEYVAPNGTTIYEDTTDIGSITPGGSTVVSFSTQLNTVGEHTAVGSISDVGVSDSATIEVVEADLITRIEGTDIKRGETVDATVSFENTGTDTSSSQTAYAVLYDNAGNEIERQEVSVRSLSPGETQSSNPFTSELNDLGSYDLYSYIDSPDHDAENYGSFEVTDSDLRANLVASDVSDTNENTVSVEVTNDGTGSSESTTAEFDITDPSGTVVKEETLNIPSVSSGSTHTQSVSFTADQGGTHTAEIDVDAPSEPAGSTASTDFDITWPNLTVQIERQSEVVEDNNADFNIQVDNVGPGQSESTTMYVDIIGQYGNTIETYELEVPSISSGSSHSTTVNHQFERPGEYRAEANVIDNEFPEGSVDQSDWVRIVHGDLEAGVQWDSSTTAIGDSETFSVYVQNVGNDVSDPTTADVEVLDGDGSVALEREINVSSLNTGDTEVFEFTPTFQQDGTGNATVNVDYPAFPIGTEAHQTIEIQSPDLRADVTFEDVYYNDYTEITVEVTNEGAVASESTNAVLTAENVEGDRVVERLIHVPALGPGDSDTTVKTQLISDKCWRTEMSCAPGAELGSEGMFTGFVDVETDYAPEGSTDSDTFYVEYDE